MLKVLLLIMFVTACAAFPFGKNSGITELTSATFNNFLNTHKPVFIMFYAPWCGHCKAMHPEWEKFAKGVKDVVRVGAVNADTHRELGQQFGIQGFPTIKYWKMGSKKGMKPTDYQGERKANGFHNAAVAEITHAVKTITSVDQINSEAAKATSGKAIILFSSKNKSPPIFSVLSQSPHFKGKISFLLVAEKAKELVKAMEVETIPAILIASKDEGEGIQKEKYDGKMDYTAIAKWLQKTLGVTSGTASDESSSAEQAEPKEEKASSEEKPKEEKKPPRPATPVRPTEFTTKNFNTFCAFGAPKVRGQQPFCVIALGEKVKLGPVHAHFENEAVLFFYAPEEHGLKVASELSDGLQPRAPLESNDVVVLRAAKDRTKYVIWAYADEKHRTEPSDTLSSFVERAVAGDITFERNPGFPKLS